MVPLTVGQVLVLGIQLNLVKRGSVSADCWVRFTHTTGRPGQSMVIFLTVTWMCMQRSLVLTQPRPIELGDLGLSIGTRTRIHAERGFPLLERFVPVTHPQDPGVGESRHGLVQP